jgi:Carboxypeptidase regulatory-like domain
MEASVNQGFRRFLVFSCIAVMALSLAIVGGVSAQIISGDLVGTVLDKTGAAVPGAHIEAVNVDTGAKLETDANDSGEYRLNNLPVGSYNVSASSPSFGTTTINGVKIQLNNTLTQQITLEIKGAVTSIEVSGVAATLDTTTAQLQSTFETKEIADLPSASTGSGVLNLSLLSSGVATSGGVGVGSGPSVGGQRPRNNNFTIEGVDNNNKGVTGPLVSVPNDAVAEFSLLQNQFSPEFGHSSGGQFNTVVKSGTNSFHGLAYIYNQNRHYDALDTIVALGGQGSGPNCASQGGSACSSPGPRFDQNRIGGQIGGPVVKNKLFFFVNYEYEPLGQSALPPAVCSPTTAGFAAINATPGLSATNLAIFEKYVAPGTITGAGCGSIAWNQGTTTDGCKPAAANQGCIGTLGLAIPAPNFTNSKFIVASMDWDISTKDQIRGRYIYNSVIGIDTAANLPAFFLPFPNKFHLVTINEYHTFTPTLTNEIRLGYNRFAQTISSGNFTFPGLDSFPNLQLNDLNQLQIGPDGNAPQGSNLNTYQLAEALTWTKGKHTVKFGIEGRKLIAPQTFTQRVRGDYEYNNTLEYLQDLAPTSFAERSNGNAVYFGDQSAIYWYVNDNYRIRPNLTINLGLRYEYTTTPFSETLQSLNAAASVPGLITFAAPQWSKNNFAPRIGIAWSPGTSGRTSIRAGFGEAFDTLFDNLGLLTLPPQLSSTNDCVQIVGQGGFPCPGTGFLASGGLPPGAGGLQTFSSIADQRAATSADLPNFQKMPKSIDWTLGIQHTFWSDYTFEIRYLGTRGIHLPAQIQLNRQPIVSASNFIPTYFTAPSQATLDASPIDLKGVKSATTAAVPAFLNAGFASTITSYQPAASSTYNGLATQMTKRFSHGFQGVLAYTYSHLIDDATAEVFSTVLAPRRAQNGLDLSADRANSILDHRHRLTLTMIYDEPFFKNSNYLLKNTLGNWEIAPIYTYQSGQWVTTQSAVDSNLNGDQAGDRNILNPNGVPGTGTGVIPLCNSTVASCPASVSAANSHPAGVVGYLAINPNAQYVQAGYGALANIGRNTLQLAPINDIDITALKRFNITERFRIEFQAQAFNLFNHPQYVGGFINDIAPIGFTGSQRVVLEPQSSDFNNPSSQFASNARTLQLALKIFF